MRLMPRRVMTCCHGMLRSRIDHAGSKSIVRLRWIRSCLISTSQQRVRIHSAAVVQNHHLARLSVRRTADMTVEKFITANQLPHLLFYGPPGTGKTSTIMALAARLYGASFRNNVLEVCAAIRAGGSFGMHGSCSNVV